MRKATFKKKADHIVVYLTIIPAAKTFTAPDTFWPDFFHLTRRESACKFRASIAHSN